jgi:hypothetical protein
MLFAAIFSIPCLAEIKIVAGGKSDFVISTAAKPGASESLAASELQRYLKQMSGAELAIKPADKDAPAKSIALHVDHESTEPMQDESWEIKSDGEHIQIAAHGSRGILYATYQFLDALGCRFLAPQLDHYKGSAEVIPAQSDVTFDGKPRSGKPQLAYRKLYVEEGHSHDAANLKQMAEWMPKVGYNILVIPTNYQGSGRVKWDTWREAVTPELQKRGLIIEVGGHGYQNFLNADMEDGALFTRHPEWFGQDAKGTRHKEKGWVLCTSNADAVAYLTKNFIDYVKARPEIQIYDFWPPDGAKWCECAQCAKLGTPSDRQAILVHHVKEQVKPVRPDLHIEVLAYHTSVLPPEHAKLDKDILLDFCPISQQFDYQINDPAAATNAGYVKGLQAWRSKFDGDISIYSYYRKYAWDSMPNLIPHYMQKDLQFYATIPTQGISTYAEPGDWFTYELNHYVLAKLAWNVNADVDGIVGDFCKARYRNDAGVARSLLQALESTVGKYCAIPNSSLKSADEIAAALDRFKKVNDAVQIAASTETGATDYNLGRLVLLGEYARQDLEIQLARARKAAPDQIQKMIQDLHDWLEKNKDQGTILMRDQRLSLKSLQRRYAKGAE